jgi:DNA invertase Pin-like site-specific DNA recombinase
LPWPASPGNRQLDSGPLLADVRAGKINTAVVYKVDRLMRSLADFAKLVELFDQHQVSLAWLKNVRGHRERPATVLLGRQ